MTRLPQPGSDDGTWGTILNDFLTQSHNSDGSIKDAVVTEAKLHPDVQAKLNATPTAADIGLGNVDNTSDAAKNSASATITNKTISGSSNIISGISQSSVTSLTSDLAAKAPLADSPRYLLFNGGWPDRPADNRATLFLGGAAATDEPTDLDLKTGDIWIPTS